MDSSPCVVGYSLGRTRMGLSKTRVPDQGFLLPGSKQRTGAQCGGRIFYEDKKESHKTIS